MASTKGSIVITGANGGLGSAMVSQIASTSLGKEYHGVYTVRNPAAPGALSDALRKGPNHSHDIMALDLSSLANVRTAADTINKRIAEGSIPRIRALILNAAYQDSTQLTMSPDGFEMGFQVNHLSHFLFTLLLLKSMDKENGRILVVGSWSHDPTDPKNDVANVKGSMKDYQSGLLNNNLEAVAKGKWSTPAEDPTYHAGYRRYGATKLCEMMFMYELAARMGADPNLRNISVVGLDPGGMSTGLLRRNSWVVAKVFPVIGPSLMGVAQHFKPNGMFRTAAKSARDALSLCFEVDVAGDRPAVVYMNGSERSDTSAECKDEAKRTALWRESIRWAGVQAEDTELERWE